MNAERHAGRWAPIAPVIGLLALLFVPGVAANPVDVPEEFWAIELSPESVRESTDGTLPGASDNAAATIGGAPSGSGSGASVPAPSGPGPMPDLAPGDLPEFVDPNQMQPLPLLGNQVDPGERRLLYWHAGESFTGDPLETPVIVVHGARPGSRLCLTAGVHGDELNGVEIIRRLLNDLAPETLSGTVIGVPIVNMIGFTRGSRYLPDRRDLNRHFPGNRRGSVAARMAYHFFEDVVRQCELLVDFHTGSASRTNLPQLRADLGDAAVIDFTRGFGSTPVLHKSGDGGNLRVAASRAGIPSVTFELGEPAVLQQEHVGYGISVIQQLLGRLGMVKRPRTRDDPQPVYYSSRWVRVDNGGLLTTTVKVGGRVTVGSALGYVINPYTSARFDITSPYQGRVLGMSLNQLMLPGYAAFNIGIATDEPQAVIEAGAYECIGVDIDPAQIDDEFDCTADTPYPDSDDPEYD